MINQFIERDVTAESEEPLFDFESNLFVIFTEGSVIFDAEKVDKLVFNSGPMYVAETSSWKQLGMMGVGFQSDASGALSLFKDRASNWYGNRSGKFSDVIVAEFHPTAIKLNNKFVTGAGTSESGDKWGFGVDLTMSMELWDEVRKVFDPTLYGLGLVKAGTSNSLGREYTHEIYEK